MDILTENDLRRGFFVNSQLEYVIDADAVITEEAKLFAKRYNLTITRNQPAGAAGATAPASCSAVSAAVQGGAKPEHLTNLNANELVPKNDLRIAFRGKLDSLQAHLLLQVQSCRKYGVDQLGAYLQEAVNLLRLVMVADVKNQPLPPWTFLGLDSAALREHSHHPEKYYGSGHTVPDADMNCAAIQLNLSRALARETEIAFSQAFIQGQQVSRPDIAELLNRLSSGLYILYCRALQGEFNGKCQTAACTSSAVMQVPVEVSARHIHLTAADVEKLFGPGHKLTRKRDLSQVGEFLSEERVTLIGPKGQMTNVAVLGPERPATQIELSFSDCRSLGVKAPLNLSGDLNGAGDLTVIGPQGKLEAKGSVIVARSHIHLTPQDAEEMKLRDGQLVSVAIDGDRPLQFRNVVVRIKPSFRKFMHIDFDEANAAHIGSSATGLVTAE